MTDAPTLTDGEVSLVATSGSAVVHGYSLTVGDERIGTVALVRQSKTVVEIRWNAPESARADGTLLRGIRLAMDHAFATFGLRRIETFLDVDDLANIRVASIAGMRREGVARGRGAEGDQAVLARTPDDPDPYTQEGFIAILNAGLPTKRVIAQGLLRDENDRVLLCELTYKSEWDLPGGVIERGEAPALGLVRELQEELGIDVTVRGLVTVNWLPAWRGWDDACVFVFDLGVVSADLVEQMTFQRTEIRGVHWCDLDRVAERGTRVSTELLQALGAADGSLPPYRESGAHAP